MGYFSIEFEDIMEKDYENNEIISKFYNLKNKGQI